MKAAVALLSVSAFCAGWGAAHGNWFGFALNAFGAVCFWLIALMEATERSETA